MPLPDSPVTRLLFLFPVALAGILTILASNSYDGDEDRIRVPVIVGFTLDSQVGDLTRDEGEIKTTVSDFTVSGTFQINTGDRLTLDRDIFTVAAATSVQLTVQASDPDDPLDAAGTLNVTSALNMSQGRNPTEGQFETVTAGTNTIVTPRADQDGADVVIGGGSTIFVSWSDLSDWKYDRDKTQDQRIASAGYETIMTVLELAVIAEDVERTVQENDNVLESMTVDQRLDVDCDNTTDGASGYTWTDDSPGTGQGDIGTGDSFEAVFGNCRFTSRGYYLDGIVEATDYVLDNTEPRRLAMGVSVQALFVAQDPIPALPEESRTSPRVNGTLGLSYDEPATVN